MWESERATEDMAVARKRIAELEARLIERTCRNCMACPCDCKARRIAELEGELRRTQELCDKAVERANELEDVDSERDSLLADNVAKTEALEKVLASAYPHPTEHPTMTEAWKIGRTALAQPTEALERVRREAAAEALEAVAKWIDDTWDPAQGESIEAEITRRAAELRSSL